MAEPPRCVSPQQLLIQIDGLSRPMLEHAIEHGAAPSLARLLRGGWVLRSLYAGVPSTTPAAQAEMFYGARQAVPAFAFVKGRRTAVHMLDPAAAAAVERGIEHTGAALLSGGSSYANIYTGGATVARFCPAAFGRVREALSRGPLHQLRSAAMYLAAGVRAAGMLAGEAVRLGAGGSGHGGRRERFKDAMSRITASVVLRDTTRLAAR